MLQFLALSSSHDTPKEIIGKGKPDYTFQPAQSNNLEKFTRIPEPYEQLDQITLIGDDKLDKLLEDVYGKGLRVHDLLKRAGLKPTQVVAVLHEHGSEITYIVLEMFQEFLFARSGGERLWYLINQRYGLHGEKPKTLESIGEEMGITRERVRELQNKALAKLRLPQRRKRLIERLSDKATEWLHMTTLQPVSQSIASPINPKSLPDFITVVRRNYPRAYEPWTLEEEQRLVELSQKGLTHDEIASQLHRKPGAIRSRLHKLGMG